MTHVVTRGAGQRGWDWTVLRAVCLRETQRVLGSSATAEDAAQEAVVRAWRRRQTCDAPERPTAWVSTIARREALRFVGQQNATRLEDLPSAAHPRHDPAREAIECPELLSAIAGLSPEDRWLLVARYWQDRTDRELAERLGVAETTVRVRLHRLRSSLRKALMETP